MFCLCKTFGKLDPKPVAIDRFFFSKLSGDAIHGDRPGEADEDAETVRRQNSVFGLSDAQRA